jgi:thioredoxin-like negative regulator of GroEL
LLLAAAIMAATLALYADLPAWIEHQPAMARLEGVFFRTAPMPGGPVAVRRPPQETREALSKLIAATPAEADLLVLRAQAAEEQLDFAAAEQDWTKFAELAPDKAAGQLALADFYHRRLRPLDEIRALDAAGAQTAVSPLERWQPVAEQRSWKTFARAVALVEAQALPVETGVAQYRAWMARYPQEQATYRQLFYYLIAHKQFAAAGELIATYQKAFPADKEFAVGARASIAENRGSVEQALAVYDHAFQPLWPPALVKDYFGLLQRTHNLRRFLEQARAAQAANPADLNAAVRVFYYYQQQGNLPAAQRALIEFRLRKEARKAVWSAQECWTLGRLFEDTQQYQEAARNYYEMYKQAGGGADAERALGGIVNVLFTAPEQPIRLGGGDLSFYKDVATMDPYPGFLNGILSLLLNSADPQGQYADEDRSSVAYFHRLRAAELLELFDARFPKSPRGSELHSRLIQAYATYGDSDGVIRGGRKFLAAFPQAAERTQVAILMAEAFARQDKTNEEFATYDALLKELAERAQGRPLGTAAAPVASDGREEQSEEEPAEGAPAKTAAAQPGAGDYSGVLERYIARLVSLKRPLDALRLLRRELDRNPNDAGLYERLAAFMQQNRFDAQTGEVYRRAIQQFGGTSWYDKLARWYLRRKQTAEFEKLTREVTGVFSGTDLEKYFAGVVNAGTSGAGLYLQFNLYAHERFPYDMAFVHNLLGAYQSSHTWNPAAWEKLLRNYWYHDDGLRAQFFQFLSKTRHLDNEVQAARAAGAGNPAAVRFLGEAEVWRSHFEEAASSLEAAAAGEPGNARLQHRAASLDRSLAAFDPRFTDRAVAIEERLQQFDPRAHATLTGLGEIYADREQFERARPYWNRIASLEPGQADGYLEAATVFWDYYLYDDALRLLGEGRKKLGNAALYAYEAGAIYENKRDYTRAVAEYIKGAMPGSSAQERLIKLSRRPAQRAIVEKLTIARTTGANPDAASIALRTAVLEAQNRRDDLVKFLLDAAARSSSFEVLEKIRESAGTLGLEEVQGRSLEREIAVATDPVERMRLRLELMRFYEGKRDLARARETVEALYAQNPAILGVVRATADFYWRNKLQRQAVDVLLAAAGAANVTLKKQFTLEAAKKSTVAGDAQRAQPLLAGLLQGDPLNAEYVAAMADTYVSQGDDRGLRDFYAGKIREISDEKRKLVLRRGLIPVLTRQKDYTAAVDQYIEIVKGYPEDEGLTREAATYAASHGLKDRLVGYFAKAVADSPKDFRWPMVMARLDTFFEDIPGAIAAYTQATAIRPERVDLHTARASLEERLMRFDDALRSYTKLYELTYRDPQWMRKTAEIHARRGETEAAVKALRTALIEGRPERPQPFFEVARILEAWNMLEPARGFAERGVELAGADLLSDNDYISGAQVYVRIMTRLRAHEAAFQRLAKLTSEPAPFQTVLGEMGAAVKVYFSPQEKASFQAFLEKQPRSEALLALARTAGLADLEARWLFEKMMVHPGETRHGESRLSELQKRRMKYDDLAHKLLAYWNVYPADRRTNALLIEAAQAYRSGGDEADELAALTLARQDGGLSGDPLARYLELVLKRDPQRLIAISGSGSGTERDAAANAAVASGNSSLALRVVAARGSGLDPVWTKAYSALVGLHYVNAAPPEIEASFVAALGTGTIGERLGKPADRKQQLAGDSWFYYGTAYGEYLAAKQHGDPEDYLPALLEGTPARADAYFTLAEYYREERKFPLALADYGHTLELDSLRGDAEDRIAEVLWEQGKRQQAIAHWKAAFQAFRKVEDERMQETFWADIEHALGNIGRRKLLNEVQKDADAALRTYFRRSGAYRADTLLRAAFEAAGNPAAGVAWIVDLVNSAPNRLELLGSFVDAHWLPKEHHESAYRRILEAAEAEAVQFPMEQYRRTEAQRWHVRWIQYLVETKQSERAQTELEALPEHRAGENSEELVSLEIRIAAQRGKVAQLVERYRRDPEKAPPLEMLLRIAGGLEPREEARRLLEFVYTGQLDQRNFTAANFLGLAELRLEEGDTEAAVALLRRMTLVADEPFQDLEAAADLLTKMGRQAEARQFLEARVKAVPWDFGARVKLGDASVGKAPEAPYDLRAQVADLAGSMRARLQAAEKAGDPETRIRLLREILADDPDQNAARLALFRAAVAAQRHQLALSAMEPLAESGGLRYLFGEGNSEEESDLSGYASGFLSESRLSTPERAAAAQQMALAYAKTGRPKDAMVSYRLALAIEPTAEARAGLDRLKAEEKLRARNDLRRPVIRIGLEQEHLVRVRLEGGDSK